MAVPFKVILDTGKALPTELGKLTVSVKVPPFVGENAKTSVSQSPGPIGVIPPLTYRKGSPTTGVPGVHGHVPVLQILAVKFSTESI